MGTRRRRVSVIYFISKRVKWDDSRMEFISNCTADAMLNAAKALKDGHLVAFPTETVYGLGADATNEKAVSRIYSVKGRPTDHPLIVHISSINKLDLWAKDIPDYAIKLAREFWPGPMTLILPRSGLAKDFITGGQNNVGLRVPNQPIALALLKKFEELGGHGIAAPSANRFGAVSPTTANAVTEELGNYFSETDLVLEGGTCQLGIESTIIDCTRPTPRILRPGFVTSEDVSQELMVKIGEDVGKQTKASGMFISHYSPRAEVVLDKTPIEGQGMIALAEHQTPNGVIRLASPSNDEDFARLLYAALRLGDHLKIQKITVFQPQNRGLGVAIRDRLKKIAHESEF
jgi:L-threonylcarbamoyladenylate synthase